MLYFQKFISFTFFFLYLSCTSYTQEYIDLAKFNYTVSSPSSFEGTDIKTTVHEMNGDLTLPIVMNNNLALLTGLGYTNTSMNLLPYRYRESVTGLTLKIGTNLIYNDKWSSTYMLLPKLSSDFRKINDRDFMLGGLALFKYKKSVHLNYKFGLYANSELFSTFLVPIFAIYYLSPNKKIEANIVLPLNADINFAITNRFKMGVFFNGQLQTYNLNTPINNETNRYLAKSSRDAFYYLQYKLVNGIHIRLSIGRTIGRSYAVHNEKVSFAIPMAYFHDNRQQLNIDFADGWLFKIGAFYRLNLNNKEE